ncbi:hypothetical protein GCM10010123_33500 [Pilimelia anulata]|uniref:Bacteriocin biosynthesis cyclodehydratase domain-containing protein n=1 Tax=Pilimelia anulata TaxID=53371 RepID=A0A8J3BDP9_9ACTN|nr:hypothetical protein [Pilimelia anulata]GGK00883.1 hypothetical protein GCM10010123_33500 [Pilimelia anulata]
MPTAIRPTLVPGLPLLRRGPRLLQFGVEPGPHCLIELPHPALAAVVDLLDGGHTVAAIVRRAAGAGVPAGCVHDLIAALRRAGVALPAGDLHPPGLPPERRRRLAAEAAALALAEPWRPPAAALTARSAARIRLEIVAGTAPAGAELGTVLARLLATAGVGRLDPVTAPARRLAITAAIADVAPDVDTGRLTRRASAVVHVGLDRPATLVALGHARRRQPHLVVGARGPIVAVGPLVPPAGGPCLGCLDRHRTDRDPGWPDLAARVLAGTAPAGAVTLHAAAAYAAGQVLALIDGRAPDTIGALVEFDRDGAPRWRRWTHHPHCDCAAPAAAARGGGTHPRQAGDQRVPA